MFCDTNIVIINGLSNTIAFFISSIFHLRNLSKRGLPPEYVYRMWGGAVDIGEIVAAMEDVRRM